MSTMNNNFNSELLMYQTEDGLTKIDVHLDNDTVWLTADQMADLFQRDKSTISRHIKNIFDDGELRRDSVVANFATTAADGKTYQVDNYNLDVVISVGYRVKSLRGTQFRIWATQILKEYIIKGFAMNDDLLKRAGGGDHFDELLARIRDIRSSEKLFYRKVLDIYATSEDYTPDADESVIFFQTVQNKMHWAAHGHTASELILARADANAPLMGMTSFKGSKPTLQEAKIAKKYLNAEELDTLNRIVSMYLDFAELQAQNRKPMLMKDWIDKLDSFLKLTERDILQGPGRVAHALAMKKASEEFRKYKEVTKDQLSKVEEDFIKSIDAIDAKLKKQ